MATVSRRLDVIPFSRKLVETGDLDPVYVMLNRSDMDPKILRRWLVAYWMFYHAGVVSRASDSGQFAGTGFWEYLRWHLEALPRGTERRHFRGPKAAGCVSWFVEKYGAAPEQFVEEIEAEAPNFTAMATKARRPPQFGPWIAFKAVDMVAQCLDVPVDWDVDDLIVYGSPISGAIDACDAEGWAPTHSDREALQAAFANLGGPEGIGRMRKPWNTLQNCGIPEVETCLCKWHSHLGGHYSIGKDIREIRHALDGWGPTADKLRELLPPEVEDDREDEPGRV
jgi:hypothetical protein